jgi:hypothetical protein
MSPYASRILVVGIAAVPLAVVFYDVGRRFVDRSPGLQKLGATLLSQKDRSLERWPLNRYASLLNDGRIRAASLMLGGLILVKSLASLVAGPLALVWLPPACLTIPPLGRAFAAVGTSAWWGVMRGEGSLWTVMMQSSPTTAAARHFGPFRGHRRMVRSDRSRPVRSRLATE